MSNLKRLKRLKRSERKQKRARALFSEYLKEEKRKIEAGLTYYWKPNLVHFSLEKDHQAVCAMLDLLNRGSAQ